MASLTDNLPDQLPSDPMHWADAWIKEATSSELRPNPNAMTLTTLSDVGWPSSRVVLCKSFVPDPGYLVFYTNYQSQKAQDIAGDSRVAATFHWDSVGRQLRIEGEAVFSPPEESDAYFATRPVGAQLGAWGSDQSKPIESRAALISQIQARAADLGIQLDGDGGTTPVSGSKPVPRPPHWGGIRIWAQSIELWVSGNARIHDRALWTRDIVRASDHNYSVSPWNGTRLQP